jgi:hypothetical protein
MLSSWKMMTLLTSFLKRFAKAKCRFAKAAKWRFLPF